MTLNQVHSDCLLKIRPASASVCGFESTDVHLATYEERTIVGYGSLLLDRPIAAAYPWDIPIAEIGGVSYTTVIPEHGNRDEPEGDQSDGRQSSATSIR